jgi:uncharacterized damage-inducible protein DinB
MNDYVMVEPSDFGEFFSYNHTVRQNYISTFQRILTWQDMTVNRETAWLSLKDTLLHMMSDEDSWIKYSIQVLEDPTRPFNYLNIRRGIQ